MTALILNSEMTAAILGYKETSVLTTDIAAGTTPLKTFLGAFLAVRKKLLSLLQWKKLALLKGFLSRYSKRFQSHFWEHFYYWVAQMQWKYVKLFLMQDHTTIRIFPLLFLKEV